MNKLREKSRIIVLTILLCMVFTGISVNADNLNERRFIDMLNELEDITGSTPLVPTIKYKLVFTFPDGTKKELYSDVNDDLFFDGTDGNGFYKVPDNITVPIGTKIEGIDLSSSKYPGLKITRWDWQVGYRGKDGSNIKKYQTFNTKNIKQVADKEGYMIFFLNVADNKVFRRKSSNKRYEYQNWSNEGNWKAKGRKMMGYQVTDWYFKTLRVKVTDKQEPNMVVRSLELVDKADGKVIDSFKRYIDPLDPFNPDKQKLERTSNSNQMGAKVEKGKTYTLRSAMQFISFEEGSFNINKPESMTDKQRNLSTKIDKNEIDVFYSYDKLISVDGKYNATNTETSKNKANKSLKNLETAIFEWDFKVPENINEKGVISVKVPGLYNPVNIYKGDDWGSVNFHINEAKNDLIAEKIELIDSNNRSVRTFKNGQKYKLRFTVKNSCTSLTTIGKGNSKLQSTIAAKIDGVPLLNKSLKSKNNLEPCKTDYLETEWFTPIGDKIEGVGVINPVHKKEGTNKDTTNDIAENQFVAENNINNFYVKDVEVTPENIYVTDKCIPGSIKAMFKVGHQSDVPKTSSETSTTVVIRYSGKEIWSGRVSIPYNSEQYLEVPINLNLCKGNHTLEVEVNPKRTIIEKHPRMNNPYSDNKDKTTVKVEEQNNTPRCSLNNESNNWRKTVRHDYVGKKRTKSIWGNWGLWHSYNKNLSRTTINLREELNIIKLKVESKENNKTFETKNKGNSKNSLGKIWVKAGHGFDISVITNYNTNDIEATYPRAPMHLKPKNTHDTQYKGEIIRRENPGRPNVKPEVSMELPLIVNGKTMTQRVLLDSIERKGRPSNLTTYHKLNKKGNNARMFYIPEDTRPGTYFIEVNTTIEEGINSKLQSCRYFEIEVLPRDTGSSHIVQ